MPKKVPTGYETLPPWLWPNFGQTKSPTFTPTSGVPTYTGPSAPGYFNPVRFTMPATQTAPPALSTPGVSPGPWASGYVMPQQPAQFAPNALAPIYNAPDAVGGGGGGGSIPWAGNQQGQAAQVARWQQAVSGYTNSAGTPIPGIPGMSFLDWYYQLGGRIVPGMSQQEANYIAAREAPYARLRRKVEFYGRGGARRAAALRRAHGGGGGGGEGEPAGETIPADTARYAPPTTNWRIG